MQPFIHPMMGRRQKVRLIAGSAGNVTSSGSTTTFTPTGTAAGDLLILICGGTTPTISGGAGSGWSYSNQVGGGTNIQTCYKILAAGDVGATFTISATANAAPFLWVTYRGPVAMTLKESVAQPSGAALTFTGFTPGSTNVAALVVGFSHGGGSAVGATFPAGWTTDASLNAFDIKSVTTSPEYASGSISITGISGAICATLWELI